MSKTRSSDVNFSIGGTAMECFIRNLTQNVEQPVIDIAALCDVGPRSMPDNMTHGYELDGHAEFQAGGSDATLWSLVGDEDGAATVFQPTGAAAGADDPNYTSSAVLASYSISSGVGGIVSYRAALRGSAALLRPVA